MSGEIWEVAVLVILGVNAVLLGLFVWRGSVGGSVAERALREELRAVREESSYAARDLREEVAKGQQGTTDTLITSVGALGQAQRQELHTVTERLEALSNSNEERLDRLRVAVESELRSLREGNERKLEEMRHTVDEKLQGALEKRLGESFRLVSQRLEAVQQGLGEMRSLAAGVGDLKRVLSNVKARGTWGEMQLGTLLEQVLTPDQFSRNVQTREDSADRVEFAIRLPGPDDDPETCVWLPVDAKFPQEDYLRLIEASENGDAQGVKRATGSLIKTIRQEAVSIRDKYLDPPSTTDFAILFVPTESLFAELLRQPGLVEDLQSQERVVIAGPTTLTAMLSSLRMGFRTLAIERRSSEVWNVLSAVKAEFDKFSEVLDKVKRQLQTASNSIDETGVRTRQMQRKLREVETMPDGEAKEFLEFDSDDSNEA